MPRLLSDKYMANVAGATALVLLMKDEGLWNKNSFTYSALLFAFGGQKLSKPRAGYVVVPSREKFNRDRKLKRQGYWILSHLSPTQDGACKYVANLRRK